MSASGHSMDRERGVSVAEYGVTPLSHPAFFDSRKKWFVCLRSISGEGYGSLLPLMLSTSVANCCAITCRSTEISLLTKLVPVALNDGFPKKKNKVYFRV